VNLEAADELNRLVLEFLAEQHAGAAASHG